ncbi:hypothetical protein HK100_006299 [Physocladia obscura]|uniref:Letm1 RBD domain-containing protein n=1 Tax=Physocladia obscura TaxID=109957 RepID=A0AAD5SRM4_9FUNG|nr:hypothetical protein HK100_006299 [Physocladia obscura]
MAMNVTMNKSMLSARSRAASTSSSVSPVSKPEAAEVAPTGIAGLIASSKALIMLYYNGSKLLFQNSKTAAALINQKRTAESEGRTVHWSRSEFLLVKQTATDMKKLPPFLLLCILIPESIPLVLMLAPSLIPSTCVSEDQIAKLRAKLKARRDSIAAAWIKQLPAITNNEPVSFAAASSVVKNTSRKVTLGWASQIPVSEWSSDSSIINIAKHAPQYFVARNLNREAVKDINTTLGLKNRTLFTSTMQKALELHWETVKGDDEYLAGKKLIASSDRQQDDDIVGSLDKKSLLNAAEMRGISTVGKEIEQVRNDLKRWLNLSMNPESVEIPPGLMLLSSLIRQAKNSGKF